MTGSTMGLGPGVGVDLHDRPLPGADAPLMDPEVARAWRETRAQLRRTLMKARSGLPLAPDDLHLPRLDRDQMVNAIHIPEDAGKLAPALEAMLRRVPDTWGRMVGCDRGWYPLVVELDRDLAQLDPGYILLQVKEKWGVLRLYFESAPELTGAMQALVERATEASKGICELCGAPGMLMGDCLRVKTLCPRCGLAEGLLPVEVIPREVQR